VNQPADRVYSSIGSLFDALCMRYSILTLAQATGSGAAFRFGDLPQFSRNLSLQIIQDENSIVTGRVALLIKSPYLFTLVYLSLFRLGLTIVPINSALPDKAVSRILASAKVDCVISDSRTETGIARTIAISEDVVPDLIGSNSEHSESIDGLDKIEEASVILYTSGTTDVPKGAVLSWHSMIANAQHIAEHLGIRESRLLGILPLHHTNGQIFNILIPFLTGSTVYCSGDYSMMSLGTFWSSIADHRIEYVDTVPTILIALLELPPTHPPDVSSLKHIICGGAPIAVETLCQFQDKFGVSVLQEYGLTEATCVTAMEGPNTRRFGTVGLPLKGNEVVIRDADRRVCQPSERGEIFIRGEYLMKGYLSSADVVSTLDSEGWLATGDLGVMDEQGFLTIVGRSKNVIIKGGETILPEDIESAACRSAWVRDAVAYGVPDPFYGEIIKLSVVWADGAPHESDLSETLRQGLPRNWLPRQIHSISAVPRNASGKIMRRDLRDPKEA
jgi:long-chain acyl-CoA synthetase